MPIITSKSNAKIEELNNKFEALGDIFDRLEKISANLSDQIITNLSNWQDWYWGNYEAWPLDKLDYWNQVYSNTIILVEKAKQQTIIKKEVIITKPKVQVPVAIKEEVVTADIPWFWYIIPATFVGSLVAILYTIFNEDKEK